MRKFFGILLSAFGLLCTMVLAILFTVKSVGTDSDLYYKLQVRYGVLETAGISGQDLKIVDEALARCLRGNDWILDSLEEISIDGAVREPFHEYEKEHMNDCRHLFDLLRTVMRLLYLAPLMTIVGIFLLNDGKRLRHAAIAACLLLLIPLGSFAFWAVADFNSAFTFFHQLLFTNDLWLLNPETDLLIRICPEKMFMQMGIRIAVMSALWIIGILLLANGFHRLRLWMLSMSKA